jgi:hypothetical protein
MEETKKTRDKHRQRQTIEETKEARRQANYRDVRTRDERQETKYRDQRQRAIRETRERHKRLNSQSRHRDLSQNLGSGTSLGVFCF